MYGIFTYIWLIYIVNVGKYTSPMDPMGTFQEKWRDYTLKPPNAATGTGRHDDAQ